MTANASIIMNATTLPATLCLSELIDLGYSRCFAFQVNHEYEMDDSDFFLFDEQDRCIWGDTLMTSDEAAVLDEDGNEVSGYVSEWLEQHCRLICVGYIDPAKAMAAVELDGLSTRR